MTADPLDRFNDLNRQGFMKLGRRTRKAKVEKPIVACDGCMDWHRKGQHTKSAAERRANIAKYGKRENVSSPVLKILNLIEDIED